LGIVSCQDGGWNAPSARDHLAGSLGRSLLHLVTLGGELCAEGIGLRVVEQDIDIDTVEGRARFGRLSVLAAEFQRELIVANTGDGLAAARSGGPKLTPAQVGQAQRLYDEGGNTVAQVVGIFGVTRATLCGHLNKVTIGGRSRAPKDNTAHHRLSDGHGTLSVQTLS